MSKLPPYPDPTGPPVQPIEAGSQPILGFPVFWVYDVKFQTQNEELSFYHRQ